METTVMIGYEKKAHLVFTRILGWFKTNWSICLHFDENGWSFAMPCAGLIGMSVYLVSTKPL